MDILRDPRYPDVDPLPLLDENQQQNLRVILESVEKRNQHYGLTGPYRLRVMVGVQKSSFSNEKRFSFHNVSVRPSEDFPCGAAYYAFSLYSTSNLKQGLAMGSHMYALRVGRYREMLRLGGCIESPPSWSNVTSKVLTDLMSLQKETANSHSADCSLIRSICNDNGFVTTMSGPYEITENLNYYYGLNGIVAHETFTVFGKLPEQVIAGISKKKIILGNCFI